MKRSKKEDPFKSMTDKELKKEYKALDHSINCVSFSVSDVMRRELIAGELGRRGYEITDEVGFQKIDEDDEE